MSFSRELKDFAGGFSGGVREGYEMSQTKLDEARADYYDKKAGFDTGSGGSGGYDPTDESGQYKGETDPEGNPNASYARSTDYGAKPKVAHSMLYNAGQWIKKELGVGGPATTPLQAQQRNAAAATAVNTGDDAESLGLVGTPPPAPVPTSAAGGGDEPASNAGAVTTSDDGNDEDQ